MRTRIRMGRSDRYIWNHSALEFASSFPFVLALPFPLAIFLPPVTLSPPLSLTFLIASPFPLSFASFASFAPSPNTRAFPRSWYRPRTETPPLKHDLLRLCRSLRRRYVLRSPRIRNLNWHSCMLLLSLRWWVVWMMRLLLVGDMTVYAYALKLWCCLCISLWLLWLLLLLLRRRR